MKSTFIEKSLKQPDKIKHYSQIKELELIKRNFKYNKSECLVVCMEEMSELIEALIEYNLNQNNQTLLHLMEEYADVTICLHELCYICDVQLEDLDLPILQSNYKFEKDRNDILTNIYKSLTLGIQTISKIIRRKADFSHITTIIIKINQSLCDLIHMYDLNAEQIELIRMLKYRRLESRLNLMDKLN